MRIQSLSSHEAAHIFTMYLHLVNPATRESFINLVEPVIKDYKIVKPVVHFSRLTTNNSIWSFCTGLRLGSKSGSPDRFTCEFDETTCKNCLNGLNLLSYYQPEKYQRYIDMARKQIKPRLDK